MSVNYFEDHEFLFDLIPPAIDALEELDVTYVRPMERPEPCGIGCHLCGGDKVVECEEVDAHDWNKVINVLYVCSSCGGTWSYKVTGRQSV